MALVLPGHEEPRVVQRQGLRRHEQHRRATDLLQPRLFKKAGLPATWQPHSWQDVLSAARAISRSSSGVVPLWIYTGQAVGEASAFRGFEVFLSGTKDRLYDYAKNKWEISGPGFTATWNLLAQMQPLEEPESMWSNPNADATVALTLIPHQRVGIVFDGSWVATAYVPGGLQPWPGFTSAYGEAGLPTQTGAAPGSTNQSGGWALSVPGLAPHPSLSQAYIEAANSASILAKFDPATGNLPPRADVLGPARLAGVGQGEPGVPLRVGPAAVHDVPAQPPGLRPGLERHSAADR